MCLYVHEVVRWWQETAGHKASTRYSYGVSIKRQEQNVEVYNEVNGERRKQIKINKQAHELRSRSIIDR